MDQYNDRNYYQRREQMTRRLAEASSDPHIRRIHLQMADQYAEKVRMTAGRPTLSVVNDRGT